MDIFSLFGDDSDNDNQLPPFLQMIMSGNGMLQPIQANNQYNKDTFLCSINYGMYNLNLVNYIGNEEGTDFKIFLECQFDPNSNTQFKALQSKMSIMDVYRYFLQSQFLNFVIAKFFGTSVWDKSGYSIDIQYVRLKNAECPDLSFRKIAILASSIPPHSDLITIANSHDFVTVYKQHGITAEYSKIPMIVEVAKCVSYYAPVVRYMLSFGFLTKDSRNFENIALYVFYETMIKKYIKDAMNTFYPYYRLSTDLADIDENMLHTKFEFGYDNNLLTLNILCSPAVIIGGDSIYKYSFTHDFNVMSIKPLITKNRDVNYDLTNRTVSGFINQTFSSSKTQIINLEVFNGGSLYEYGEDYNRFCPKYVICSLNRLFEIQPEVEVANDFYEEKSSCEKVITYWIPENPHKFKLDNDEKYTAMNIYGFINFKCKSPNEYEFKDVFKDIETELKYFFNLTKKDFTTGKRLFRASTTLAVNTNVEPYTCYYEEGMFRVALLSFDRKVAT